jgi:hypothetical protein
MSLTFDPKSCIGFVRLGLILGHYLTTSVAFGESVCKSNLKTNGDINKGIEKTKTVASYVKLFQNGTQMKIG